MHGKDGAMAGHRIQPHEIDLLFPGTFNNSSSIRSDRLSDIVDGVEWSEVQWSVTRRCDEGGSERERRSFECGSDNNGRSDSPVVMIVYDGTMNRVYR
jgi:hypothetical protein